MWPFTTPYPEKTASDIDGATYDYVVVGGGTGGCVVASRLSEDPNVSVLVIEKGKVGDNFVSRIPLLSQNFLWPSSQSVSTRYSEPLAHAHGKQLRLWSAEAVGGSSRINAMLLTRGPPAGYDQWAQEMGLDNWSWKDVEPYFKKMENCKAHPGKEYHGYEGPLINKKSDLPFGVYPYLEKASEAVGLPIRDDLNDPQAPAQGYFHLDATVDDGGQRLSTYRAYLNKKVALEREQNLTVCTGVVASKLEVDFNAGQVTGVHIRSANVKDTRNYFVKARREVIVCNGALRTPQLLLLSGIGPKKHVESHGINPVRDLPAVGNYLEDHYATPIMLELPVKDTLHKLSTGIIALWHLLLYFLFGRGIMAAPSTQTTVFVRTTSMDPETATIKTRDDHGRDSMDASKQYNIPDIEIMINPVNSIHKDLPGRSLLSFYTTVLQPSSQGRIELMSTDPHVHPRVHYPLLTDERDLIPIRAGARLAFRLAEGIRQTGYPHAAPVVFGPGMDQKVLGRLMDEIPDPVAAQATSLKEMFGSTPAVIKELEFKPIEKTWRDVTDEEIDAYVRRSSFAAMHYSSSCRMSRSARDGVVDSRLRVHGLRGLRIADSSVFPKVPAAHTMAPTVMVGERCADFIKEEWAEKKMQ